MRTRVTAMRGCGWFWALLLATAGVADPAGPLPHLTRVYTVVSVDVSGGWLQVLRHFLASLHSSQRAALDVHVLRFNVSSPMRVAAVGGEVELEDRLRPLTDLVFIDAVRGLAASMTRPRFVAWHIAMLFKAESWARIARSPGNAGHMVVCADADHTFFPGWEAVVESCLQHHDLCFETNLKATGSKFELRASAKHFALDETPNESFWHHTWVNTGLFAMRCCPATQRFWTNVAQLMRFGFSKLGTASDQNDAIWQLRYRHPDLKWGILDPYAVNQLSPFSLELGASRTRPVGGAPTMHSHSQRMLDDMVLHHAAYLGTSCGANADTGGCKLRLMQLANATWFARRGLAAFEGSEGSAVGVDAGVGGGGGGVGASAGGGIVAGGGTDYMASIADLR